MRWYEDEDLYKGQKYISLKEGESVTFTVEKIYKDKNVDTNFQLKRKDGTFLGWCIRVETTEGQSLTVSSFALLALFRDKKIDSGDKIKIYHKGHGDYQLDILEKADEFIGDEIQM